MAIRKATTSSKNNIKVVSFSSFSSFLHNRCSFLFDFHSLFYYALTILLIGFLWMGYAILVNNFSVLYGWDYSSQYVTMSYEFWDMWHDFFATGSFPLYSSETYFGTDNIGSNSYYGLFDPFLIIGFIFPRSWMPQIYVISAMLKGVFSALAMRAYLRYMGISESSSRLGALAYAFSGYLNFMVGFPTYLSMAVSLPLILLGIEKLLREQKISYLVFGLFLLGVISFFFLVVICIWGVIYAVWRYFMTIKKRSWKLNLGVIAIGIFSFVIGISLSAWTLLPSVRQSALSGRTVSVGRAYLDMLISATKNFDIPTMFGLLFEPVGLNAGRELQGLIGFFFPTCNYLWLPLAKGSVNGGTYNYDSWTASLFCYTPLIILFFTSLFRSIRRRKWSHIIAFLLCLYLVFTNFAYYFFYAFAGDGYGRWYIVLIPLIIYYAVDALDHLKEEPRWVLPAGALTSLALTFFTWVITVLVLKDQTIEVGIIDGYYKNEYEVPGSVVFQGVEISLIWLVYYQIALVTIVSIILIVMKNKASLHKILFGITAFEIIISGNLSFFYGYMTPYNSFNGGPSYYQNATDAFNYLDGYDDSYYRAYSDTTLDKNTNMEFGYNGSSTFHSLFNYEIADLARYSYMTNNESYRHDVYGQDVVNKSWSGYYANKRSDFDFALGNKYYVIQNEGYTYGYDDWTANLPWGSTLVYENDLFRVYENHLVPELGHAVDYIYQEHETASSSTRNHSAFYTNTSGTNAASEAARNERVYVEGAIVQDEDAEEFFDELAAQGSSLAYSSTPVASMRELGYERISTSRERVETVHGSGVNYGFFAVNEEMGIDWGPTYFLSHLEDSNVVLEHENFSGGSILRDYDKIVTYPSSGFGDYLNEDQNGAYFLLDFSSPSPNFVEAPRLYFVGDTFNEDGTIKEENVLLSYEYRSMQNWTGGHVNYWGGQFGFYVEGRAKYIVACYKGSGEVTYRGFTTYKMERSVLESIYERVTDEEHALNDVDGNGDHFTFTTSFNEPKVVVTQLAYDAGWHLKSLVGDEEKEIQLYRLNGGFLGFIAPEGEVSYQLDYFTPYLDTGVYLAMGGFSLYLLYEFASFLKDTRKLKKSLSIETKK